LKDYLFWKTCKYASFSFTQFICLNSDYNKGNNNDDDDEDGDDDEGDNMNDKNIDSLENDYYTLT